MNKMVLISGAVFVVMFLLFLPSCRLSELEKNLSPENAEFLSLVKYIITKEERKIFLELPDEKKEEFKKEFWKRRDPDTGTEENEFQELYFERIEDANRIFRGEGIPGYLTQRGRVYILYGPPTSRLSNAAEIKTSGSCVEVWYYGNFPVYFVTVLELGPDGLDIGIIGFP